MRIRRSVSGLVTLGAFWLLAPPSSAGEGIDPQNPAPPAHELRLTLPELSVLHGAAVAGVAKYGGEADFHQTLFREEKETLCRVTITNPRLFEVWSYWMAERTAELLAAADLDNLQGEIKAALRISQVLRRKIEEAARNPRWSPVKLAGKLTETAGRLLLEAESGSFELEGENMADLRRLAGASVAVEGFHKVKGRIEVLRFLEKRERTLEVFVMSFCPYARQAEAALLRHLRSLPAGAPAPRVEFRYLFYRKEAPSDPKGVRFLSLHGDAEVEENLVQILLREFHPALFHEYLLQRSSDDRPWKEILLHLGMSQAEVAEISRLRAEQGEAWIESEYAYASDRYRILDGSPTFVWEGEAVSSLRKVKEFAGIELPAPSCNSQPQ